MKRRFFNSKDWSAKLLFKYVIYDSFTQHLFYEILFQIVFCCKVLISNITLSTIHHVAKSCAMKIDSAVFVRWIKYPPYGNFLDYFALQRWKPATWSNTISVPKFSEENILWRDEKRASICFCSSGTTLIQLLARQLTRTKVLTQLFLKVRPTLFNCFDSQWISFAVLLHGLKIKIFLDWTSKLVCKTYETAVVTTTAGTSK